MNKLALSDDILLKVEKPARYTGEELNSIKKDYDLTDVRFAFCFPDTYEIGMSNLGLKILYEIINNRSDALCERVFMPNYDMLIKMREHNFPLFSLENKKTAPKGGLRARKKPCGARTGRQFQRQVALPFPQNALCKQRAVRNTPCGNLLLKS